MDGICTLAITRSKTIGAFTLKVNGGENLSSRSGSSYFSVRESTIALTVDF